MQTSKQDEVANLNWKVRKWLSEKATRLQSQCYFKVRETVCQAEGPVKTLIRTSGSETVITGCGAESKCKWVESKNESWVTYEAGGFWVLSYCGEYYLLLLFDALPKDILKFMALLVNIPESTSLFFHFFKNVKQIAFREWDLSSYKIFHLSYGRKILHYANNCVLWVTAFIKNAGFGTKRLGFTPHPQLPHYHLSKPSLVISIAWASGFFNYKVEILSALQGYSKYLMGSCT